MTTKTKKTVTELTIDRAKWLRGEHSEASMLLRPEDGKMCCLGFLALECGLSERQITNMETPRECSKVAVELFPNWLVDKSAKDDTPVAADLMQINDDADLASKQRESQLKKIFAKQGIAVKFVGRTPRSKTKEVEG